MRRIVIIMIVMLILIGCGEKPKVADAWREDFLSERLEWKTYLGDQNWQLEKGNWIIKGIPPFEELAVIDRDWSFSNYAIKVTIRLGEKGEAGLVLGFNDKNNFWRLTLDHSKNRIALIERRDGSDNVVAEGAIALKHNEYHKMEVEITNYLLSVKCDELLIFQVGKPGNLHGRLGLFAGISAPPDARLYVNFGYFEVTAGT